MQNLRPARASKTNMYKDENQRGRAAASSTYELILGAAAAAADAGPNDEAVLAQADAARAAFAFRNAASGDAFPGDGATLSSTNDVIRGANRQRNFPQRRRWRGELSPEALTHEAAAAGRLGRWDRVSGIIDAALAKTPTRGGEEEGPIMRGVAGARLYASLISAAIACGRPERGLEIYQEMTEEENNYSDESDDKDTTKYDYEGNINGERTPMTHGQRLRLPPPDWATLLAALDACQALNNDRGSDSVVGIAIGVAKQAAALARKKLRTSATGAERESESGSVSISGSRFDPPAQTVYFPTSPSGPTRKMALVLSRAAEVCAPWEPSTAEAFRIKAAELECKGAATVGVGARFDGT